MFMGISIIVITGVTKVISCDSNTLVLRNLFRSINFKCVNGTIDLARVFQLKPSSFCGRIRLTKTV